MSYELLYTGIEADVLRDGDYDDDDADIDSEIDLEHLSLMRHAGKELLQRGQTIGCPIEADDWDYLVATTLITAHNDKFKNNVMMMYLRSVEDAGDPYFIPSISEIADAIDEWNMVVIQEFYSKYEYLAEDIDIINANYIQEFSCLMEDWVEDVLRNSGYAYCGSSVARSREIQDDYAPQNILLTEFLR